MTNEDLLQERLEQLENGAPLSKCLAGLPENEKEMIRVAAALRDVPVPAQASQAVTTQREQVVAMARQAAVGARVSLVEVFSSVRSWWRQQTAFDQIMAVGVSPAVIILVIGLVASLFAGPQASLVVESDPAAGPTVSTETLQANTAVIEADAPSQAIAAAPEAAAHASRFETFVPLATFPLTLDAGTAAVENARGFVQLLDENGDWQKVEGTALIKAGQRVRTGKLSSATLLYNDGSQARLGPSTELSIDSLDAQRAENGQRTVVMTQWIGESDHQVASRHDGASRYEVKTPSGSGVAMGTTFHVLVTEDQKAQFSVDEGAVAVTNEEKTVLVEARQITTVSAQEVSDPAFYVTGRGEVTAMGDSWTIGGQTFAINGDTVIVGDPQLGDTVLVIGHVDMDTTLVADQIFLLERDGPEQFTIVGEVESMDGDSWVIAGQTVSISGANVDAGIDVGDMVRAEGIVGEDGSLLAQRISLLDDSDGLEPFEFTGVVESKGDPTWTVSGVDITVDGQTEIKGDPVVGDLVKVEGWIQENGDWLADEIKLIEEEDAKFEFTGVVEDMDPWMVSGIGFETDGSTEIDSDIMIGDLVKVEGHILADGTWLADEIKLLDEDDDDVMVEIIGTVDSMDPWSVSGYPFDVDGNTEIDAGIDVGSLVKVKALVREDGSWLATEIELLDDDDVGDGCFTITAEVLAFTGDELVINGWPDFPVGDDAEIDGNVAPGSVVVITICMSEEGELVVKSILVLIDVIPPDDEDDDDGQGQEKVTVCHKPDKPKGGHEITIAEPAVPAHLAHGDYVGECTDDSDDTPGPPDEPGPPSNNGNGNGKPPKDRGDSEGSVTLCHKPDGRNGGKTMTVPGSAAAAHLGHGDTQGACSSD